MGGPAGPGGSLIVQAFHQALTRQAAVIFLALVVILVAWNGLRTLQYRRAIAAGESFPPPRPEVGPEPVARRVLRLGFGVVWIIDGLLQLQSNMPVDLPGNVLQPAASSSPGWVQHLVDFGASAWTRHPASAAASAVWIQLGIGLFLIVAPRGRWSQVAGLASVGWGLVVWVFGEAFGGIFAPGPPSCSAPRGGPPLRGGRRSRGPARPGVGGPAPRPGPDRVAGRLPPAWPCCRPGRAGGSGRGAGEPGDVGRDGQQMATTPQPHFLGSAGRPRSPASTSPTAGRQPLRRGGPGPAGWALVSGGGSCSVRRWSSWWCSGLADWVLIEDFGCVRGAPVRIPTPWSPAAASGRRLPGGRAGRRPPDRAAPAAGEAPPKRRPAWWERLDSGYAGTARRLAAAVVVFWSGRPHGIGRFGHVGHPRLADRSTGRRR